MLLIVNKNGGLVYSQVFKNTKKTYDSNELMKLGSSFYSMVSISAQIAPKCQLPTGIDF